MTRFLLGLTLAAATSANAQLNTVPLTYATRDGDGVGTGTVLVARGLNGDSGEFWALAALLDFGLTDRLSIGGGLGTVQALESSGDRELRLQAAGTVAFRLIRTVPDDGSGTTSVSLLTGAGYAPLGDDASEVNVPVGFGIARGFQLGGLAIETWTVPRLTVRRIEIDRDRATQFGGALSAGATIGFSPGASLIAAVDYRTLGEEHDGPITFPHYSPFSAAVGIHFRSGR